MKGEEGGAAREERGGWEERRGGNERGGSACRWRYVIFWGGDGWRLNGLMAAECADGD